MKFEEIFQAGEDVSLETVLNQLMNKKDIELKTEITNPLAMTRLRVLASYGSEKGFPKTAEILNAVCDWNNLHMVSKGRGGRKEIISGFASIMAHNERMKGRDRQQIGGNGLP
jgi:hypothetical protein